MTESAFDERVDELLQRIEEAIDDSDMDIDYENNGSLLSIQCENGSSIIISRQLATQELWLAAKSGGFHYHFDETAQVWKDTRSACVFHEQLSEVFLQQTGKALSIDAEQS